MKRNLQLATVTIKDGREEGKNIHNKLTKQESLSSVAQQTYKIGFVAQIFAAARHKNKIPSAVKAAENQ